MTCGGWGIGEILGGCSMAWLSLAIIFFLALIARRQCSDGILAGTGFNLIGSIIGGLGSAILVITLTGEARWSLVAGLAGLAIGGYVVGLVYDQTGGDDYA